MFQWLYGLESQDQFLFIHAMYAWHEQPIWINATNPAPEIHLICVSILLYMKHINPQIVYRVQRRVAAQQATIMAVTTYIDDASFLAYTSACKKTPSTEMCEENKSIIIDFSLKRLQS